MRPFANFFLQLALDALTSALQLFYLPVFRIIYFLEPLDFVLKFIDVGLELVGELLAITLKSDFTFIGELVSKFVNLALMSRLISRNLC